jgi:uncharacterized protein YegP (UPF0339 family)
MMDEHSAVSSHHLPVAANDERQSHSQLDAPQASEEGQARFEVYRTDRVSLTSTLFGGGDWHWRLLDRAGAVVADCGGYKSHGGCRAAVVSLQSEAGNATVPSQEQI